MKFISIATLTLTVAMLPGSEVVLPKAGNDPQSKRDSAARILRFILLPAEVEYQGQTYSDSGNGVGQYAPLADLRSKKPDGQPLELVPIELAKDHPAINGYLFALFLPSRHGAGLDTAMKLDSEKDAEGIGLRTRYWIAYAWPEKSTDGDTIFAIDQFGRIYKNHWEGNPPHWNDLYEGNDWGSDQGKSWHPLGTVK